MKKLNKLKNKLKKIEEENKYASNHYGSELCAGDMLKKEEKIKNKIKKHVEDNLIWKIYAAAYKIKSGKAYKHIFMNHFHSKDVNEDCVTFNEALKAIKKAEDELIKKYENK